MGQAVSTRTMYHQCRIHVMIALFCQVLRGPRAPHEPSLKQPSHQRMLSCKFNRDQLQTLKPGRPTDKRLQAWGILISTNVLAGGQIS